jgi:DNA-binding LytR/AlgR family response regulator
VIAATALIAEDEPLLAAALAAELAIAWPELRVLATVGDGHSAVAKALELQPDVLFFDIQMPGMSGLDAALTLIDEWPEPAEMPTSPTSPSTRPTPSTSAAPATPASPAARGKPFPALVFVTAYDQYAVQAFEAQAIDYVLKPINQVRIKSTVKKLIKAVGYNTFNATTIDSVLVKLRPFLPVKSVSNEILTVIQASVGNAIHMVQMAQVLCFEAADKYVRVLTAGHEYLIRTPLKELLPQLDASVFWQVHRGTVVRAQSIEQVSKDEAGKLWLTLRGLEMKIAVSRLYAHQFKAM